MVGIIIDSSLNEKNEIETIFTFAKNIYEEDYMRALEKMHEGSLSVSFELLATREGQEILQDGTIRLHDIDFQGQGLLIDETPAYKKAIVFDMAKKYKARAEKEKELIYANKIVQACDKVLAQEDNPIAEAVEPKWTTITTRDNWHIHVIKVDMDGNGETVGTFGDDDESHEHKIVNYQIQEKNQHAHRIIEELLAKRKEEISNNLKTNIKEKIQTKQGGNNKMTEEQIKLIAELRNELGDFAKDVSDEQLLDEAKVEELKKAKTDSEEQAKEEKTELEVSQAKVVELEAQNAELIATIEAKNSEIEVVRENAEKIGKLKVEMKDNTYVAEFKDEDYLNNSKIKEAKLQKENDDLKIQNEELANKNAETKEKLKASEKANDSDDDLNTGHDDKSKNVSTSSLIARLNN